MLNDSKHYKLPKIMNQQQTTQQHLIHLYKEDQKQILELQKEALKADTFPSTDSSKFLTQTLSSLQIYFDVNNSNIQLRELQFYKTKMLKFMIEEVSAQLLRFKQCILNRYSKFNQKDL